MSRRKRGKRRNRRGVKSAAALLRKAERDRIADEAKHDRTRQRRFERAFLSRDLPDSKAARADASDRGRQVSATVTRVDAPTRRERQIAAVNVAAAMLPRKSGWLRKLLWAIFRNGSDREQTMAELRLSKSSYWWGVNFFLKFYSGQ